MTTQPKHTTTPWYVGVAPGPIIYGDAPRGVQVANMMNPLVFDDENKANTQRIIKCVNACERFSNDALDSDILDRMAEALERVSPWLGKALADGLHKHTAAPNDLAAIDLLVTDILKQVKGEG